ncbi:hypothetical protein [Sulfurovum mangrovi]|uniref:hypothetical protein n=1 Tax=Sulfurovum mangrovi TaxID=2893889 RepID=UPI001E50AD4B|nr:hypothetical protein [Sulfurovum mangrovi]UFH58117.1 hypothetical protein LN246_07105 [Sulfurovum mangrovi]
MNILAVSVLFARGTNLYNKLQCIVNCSNPYCDIRTYNKLLETMKEIYSSDNTRANRDRLQNFILDHGNIIQEKYLMLCMSGKEEKDVYSLKEYD